MTEFGFYDIVRVRRTAETIRLGIADRIGVIQGISTPDYVAVDIDGEVYSIDTVDLESTGGKADPEVFRSVGRIAVRPQSDYDDSKPESEDTE